MSVLALFGRFEALFCQDPKTGKTQKFAKYIAIAGALYKKK